MRAALVAFGIFGFVGMTATASAVRAQVPRDGLYEGWSSLLMRPVGPLSGRPVDLPEWIDVVSAAGITTVTFVPERRVVWQIAWGPHGATEKRVEVDGQPFATATYERDAAGHLVRKTVTGPGVQHAPWVYEYTTDSLGRPVVRRTQHPPRMPWGSRRLVYPPIIEEQRITWGRARVTVSTLVEGIEVRRDEHGPDGSLRRTIVGRPGDRGHSLELIYVRDRHGALQRVMRRLGQTTPSRVAPTARDHTIGREVMAPLGRAPLERREALMLLGAPHRTHDEGAGAHRRVTDDWAERCWLNDVSGVEWDGAGLAIAATAPCICGLCVDATLPVEASDVLGVDLHWARGPWVRLDGAIDVTADHRVISPHGPVEAGRLRAGDGVIAADGSLRVLRSVEPLLESGERLGRNVRTTSATFAAGGILFESEPLRRCAPGD